MSTTKRATIIKRQRNREYTVAPNQLLNDKRLTVEAVGMLMYILSKPQGWAVITGQLSSRFDIGREKTHKILRSLRETGYSTREFERDENGRIVGQFMVFYDEPQPDEDPDKPANKPTPAAEPICAQDESDFSDSHNTAFQDTEKQEPVNQHPVVKKDIYKLPPKHPPQTASPAASDQGGAGGAEEKVFGTRADGFDRPGVEQPCADSPERGGRERHDADFAAEERLDVLDGFDEMKIIWRPYNPRYLDDALSRWKQLSIEQRAKAKSRAQQYFSHKQAEARKANKAGKRVKYCTLAEWLGDRIFESFGVPITSAVPKPPRHGLDRDEALNDNLALAAAHEGWISAFYDFVGNNGRLPNDLIEIDQIKNGFLARLRHNEELERQPNASGHTLAVTLLAALRPRQEMLTRKTLKLHGQNVSPLGMKFDQTEEILL